MSESYQVVFTGELSPDTDAERVIERFSEKFKLERAKAEKLIRGAKSVVLKKGLELEKAEKYLAVLHHLGMVVELDPKPPAPEPEEAAPSLSGLALEPIDNGGGDTTEVLDPSQLAADRCPKCGSRSMELGICQDCGIVASKFLAAQVRQAEMGTDAEEEKEEEANPYSAPEADLVEPMEGEMDGPHGVPASHGWAWIAKGWWHFKEAPVAWILALVIWVVLIMVIGIVPLVGIIVILLTMPVITAGFMYGCFEQDQGEDFAISHLFTGFSNNAGQLFLLGAFNFLLMLLVGGAIMVLMISTVGLGIMAAQDPESMAMMFMAPGFILLFLAAFLLTIPAMMAYIFAPALVVLDDVSALTAMKLSFMGSLKNLLPLTIYGLIAHVLMFVGSLPFGLGLLLVIPVLTAAIYSAYRDIYYS
ncbi:MAG: hypothetical protein KZQ80_05795 [Candidatus Thiodiazotropha sp. (ex Monitilora ramsayi)]|nr:hypothetical protein [Candidatus Thiodiazotropha sp. (ex Monitilora ramsayi)]